MTPVTKCTRPRSDIDHSSQSMPMITTTIQTVPQNSSPLFSKFILSSVLSLKC
uniref:Uncharacterized protein n=1 Tax=Anguilla anguilla TaxID=7936 RepID=A0A0E9S426_ANGAN